MAITYKAGNRLVSTGVGWYIDNTNYDSKKMSVATQTTYEVGNGFSSDGTKFYQAGDSSSNRYIWQYTLSTAWDISTGSYASKNFNFTTQESDMRGFKFKTDGTKVYIVGAGNNTVFQYSLSTAWDISTASYENKSFSHATQGTNGLDVDFSSDGTKMYVASNSQNKVFQYTLSTAWDVSTASYASKEFAATGVTGGYVYGAKLSSDGTKIYVLNNGAKMAQYTLTTAWDISTATYTSFHDFGNQNPSINNPYFSFKSDDGLKIYVSGNDRVYQYTTPYPEYPTADGTNENGSTIIDTWSGKEYILNYGAWIEK